MSRPRRPEVTVGAPQPDTPDNSRIHGFQAYDSWACHTDIVWMAAQRLSTAHDLSYVDRLRLTLVALTGSKEELVAALSKRVMSEVVLRAEVFKAKITANAALDYIAANLPAGTAVLPEVLKKPIEDRLEERRAQGLTKYVNN